MTVYWPLLVARLVVLLPSLPGFDATGVDRVDVFDGPPLTDGTAFRYMTVGYVDDEDNDGTCEPGPQGGDLYAESGTVRSEIVAWTGGADLAAQTVAAFELFSAVADAVAADTRLGVLRPGSNVTVAAEPARMQRKSGAVCRLPMTFSYLARA